MGTNRSNRGASQQVSKERGEKRMGIGEKQRQRARPDYSCPDL